MAKKVTKKVSPSTSTDLVPASVNALAARVPGGPLPALVIESGRPGATAWDDFFDGKLGRNKYTRLAYERAVRYFLTWAQDHVPDKSLIEITAGDVGRYLASMPGGIQKKSSTSRVCGDFSICWWSGT